MAVDPRVRARRRLAGAYAALLLLTGCAGGDGEAAPPGTPPPAAGGVGAGRGGSLQVAEVGVTESELHVAVLVDVDNPTAPGLAADGRDAMEAWARVVNTRGGLAGRKVVLDVLDTRYNPDESTRALAQACERSLALVGGRAGLLFDAGPLGDCPDRTGEPIGLPDLAARAVGPVEAGHANTWALLGNLRDPRDPAGEVWTVPRGPLAHARAQARAGRVAVAAALAVPDARATATALTLAARRAGAGTVEPVDVPETAGPSPAAVVTGLRRQGVTLVVTLSAATTLKLRREARAQDAPVTFLCLAGCTAPAFVGAGADADGTLVPSPLAPLDEGDLVPGVRAYVDAVGPERATTEGLASFAQGLLFERLVADVVARGGVDGVTRRALLDRLRTAYPPDFTAAGINGARSTPVGAQSDCWVVLSPRAGRLVRRQPAARGAFECAAGVDRFTTGLAPR